MTRTPDHIIEERVQARLRGVNTYDGKFTWRVGMLGRRILWARADQEEARGWVQEDIDAGEDTSESQTRLAQAEGREKGLLEALEIIAPKCDIAALLDELEKEEDV